MSDSPGAASGTKLKETGKVLMVLGFIVPAGLEAAVRGTPDGAARAMLLIATDLARLLFFAGLACFLIGRRRERA